MNDVASGAGRLYYQTPVIQVMSRELSSFTDLQKTLAQLGFNDGSTLLRLSFRISETPLEEAMAQIEEYFQSVDGTEKIGEETLEGEAPQAPQALQTSSESNDQVLASDDPSPPESELAKEASPTVPDSTPSDSLTSVSTQQTRATSTGRAIQIFSPPTSTTPSAALTDFNPADYVPSIEHAKAHQKHLQEKSRNTRLPSEAELADQESAEAEKRKAVKDVDIKIRFPDQSSAVSTFAQQDTGADLYAFVRDDCLDDRWRGEKFHLSYSASKGWLVIPDDASKKLIQHLGLRGRVLVNFKWDEVGGASLAALGTKDVLKRERKEEAQALKAPEVPGMAVGEGDGDGEGVKVNVGKGGEEGGEEKRKGVPKWLKLPGKK